MKYAEVQVSLETFVKANWLQTSIAFNNVPLVTENLAEFIRCDVAFGEAEQRCLPAGNYRQFGLLILSSFVRPNKGTYRLLQIAQELATLVRSTIIPATVDAPAIQLVVPSITNDYKARDNWVMAQVSCPFYYDI